MRQKKAKAIKKSIYGNDSTKVKTYKQEGGTIICTGKRAKYQKAKKEAN